MVEWALLASRYLHILFAIGWIGGALFSLHVVGPGLKRAPPHVRGPATLLIQEKAMAFYMVSAPLTVVFGVLTQYLIVGDLSRMTYQGSTWAVSLGAALVVSVVMLVLALGVARPAFARLKALALASSGGPPPAEAAGLQRRLMISGIAVTALGLVAVGLMVVAASARTGAVPV